MPPPYGYESGFLKLTDVRAVSVLSFLEDYSTHVKSVGSDKVLPLRDCIAEDLMSCFSLLHPNVKKSDSELRKYLESLLGYNSIEEAYSALDALSMDDSIVDPQARVFQLLRELMVIQKRSKEFEIPDSCFLPRFAKAVRPKGLSLSLLCRISDGLLPTLATLVETTIDDLLSFERTLSWKRSSTSLSSEPPLKKLDRGTVFKERRCFKCHEAGHPANVCPKKAKVEAIRFLNTTVYCSSSFVESTFVIRKGEEVVLLTSVFLFSLVFSLSHRGSFLIKGFLPIGLCCIGNNNYWPPTGVLSWFV
ncbi:hypothetical protein RCL1_009072 [Eukaryota sp. TZLM3-RCL]